MQLLWLSKKIQFHFQERERREKKLYKQLEKQQKKLAAKGIHVDIETLKKDYETQRAGGKSSLNLEAALAAAAAASGEEIDVVGGIEDSLDSDGGHPLGPIMNHHHQTQTHIKFGQRETKCSLVVVFQSSPGGKSLSTVIANSMTF